MVKGSTRTQCALRAFIRALEVFVMHEVVKPNIKAGPQACQGILAAVPVSSHVVIYGQRFGEINNFSSLPLYLGY